MEAKQKTSGSSNDKLRFFFCSDTHGESPPNPPKGTDIVVHAGDFYNRIGGRGLLNEHNDLSALREYIDNLESLDISYYAVRGNHDCSDPSSFFKENDLTGGVVEISKGLFLVGLGWHGKVFADLPNTQTLSKVCARLLEECSHKMKDGDHSIFITHYCASGVIDESPGWVFDCVRDVATTLRSIAVIQGHIHELFGQAWLYDGIKFFIPGPQGMTFDLDLRTKAINIPE